METENFVAFDLQKEYVSTLRATRVASTVLLVLCGAWCWQQYLALQFGAEILENTVQGGLPYLPVLTRVVIENGMAVTGMAALGVLSALVFIWSVARSLSHVILATTTGAGLSVLVGLLFNLAVNSPLQTVFTKFAG